MKRNSTLKRTGFKKPSYEEAMKKQRDAQKRAAARKKAAETVAKAKTTRKPQTAQERRKSLKTRLWTAFSRYIRAKDADQYGMVMTCDGKRMHWKKTHCGHLFVNSERNQQLGGNELWYYENNFAPQSANGNYFNADDSAKKYMLWAIRKYGAEEVEEMERMKNTPRKFTEEELEEKLRHYRQAFAKLEVS